ncbi:ABC transporter substrate-binding protein [Marinobacterium arenosum]|uniref:ABC transporter substrate-binding protein n=1 Tax=Marinobacterium arenosum TaxID=2862496 RepID=UPI001C957D2B|nr:ABC transporter substrate-binding protein [Marinobacterium arenosum]MBY4675031.1 ABC transporter substrate-binding protein [Marinobacterium arenosum]
MAQPIVKAVGLVLAFLLLVTGGCSDRQAEPAELHIGLVAALSGPIAGMGEACLAAAELAVGEVNSAGGLEIDGRRYRLVLHVEDNQDSAEQATSAALRLINQDNVVAIVGPLASRNAIPAARIAEQAGIPMISPSSTNPETTRGKQWVFRAAFIDTFQGRLMARFARQQLGLSRAAVLFDVASEYNRGLAEYFRATFEELGGEVVAYEAYTRDVADISEQLQRIKNSGAELLFLPNYYSEVPDQARQAREMGIDAQLMGGDSWAQIRPVDRVQVEGAFFSGHYAVDSVEPAIRAFADHFRQLYGRDADGVAALSYDAFGLLFRAMQLGGVEPQGIRDALLAMPPYEGVTGRIDYLDSGDPVRSAVVQEVRDGSFQFRAWVEP